MKTIFLILMFLIPMVIVPTFAQVDTSVEVNLIQNEESSEILAELKMININIKSFEKTLDKAMILSSEFDTERNKTAIIYSFTGTLIGTTLGAALVMLWGPELKSRLKQKIELPDKITEPKTK